MKCGWCHKVMRFEFHGGKQRWRCRKCSSDHRTPVEKRRDRILNKYGDDPAAYTPKVLSKLATDGLFDITASFCPAGKLSMEETRRREAAAILSRDGPHD